MEDVKVFNQCLEAVFFFDKIGIITKQNKAAVKELGESLDEKTMNIACVFPNVFSLHDNQLCFSNQNSQNTEGDSTYCETFAYRWNKTCFPVRLKVILPEDEREGVCFAINVSEEKNALKKVKSAKDELNKAINVKNEFLANITHELRTPVNGIRGIASNMLDSGLTAEQQQDIGVIIHCCDNMVTMVNEILDFSKLAAGKLELESREFNFKDFIHQTLSYHITKVQEKGLKLIVSIGAGVPNMVIGDELRLGQILNNLLSNAVKFTILGKITVEILNTSQTEDTVELLFLVTDTGIGISQDEMDKLFHSFSQVDGSITRRFGGTGLGLVISKRLVEQMGGQIHVDSIKGKGSTFSFTIPLGIKNNESKREYQLFESNQYLVGRGGSLEKLAQEEQDTRTRRDSSYEEDESNRSERLQVVRETLEKLMICIELGNWEKAERFAGVVKSLFYKDEREEWKRAFSLELAVRKEDYNGSMERIKDMQKLLF